VDGSDPLTPVERLFMEAGYSRTLYMAWRLSILPSLKTMSRMARLASGWPSDAIDEEAEELKLAKGWLEGEARRAAAAREKGAAEEESSRSRDGTGPVFGPVMTTSEAKVLIQQEIEGGRPTQGLAAGGAGTGIRWARKGAPTAKTGHPHCHWWQPRVVTPYMAASLT
jgi:hypothetical protein